MPFPSRSRMVVRTLTAGTVLGLTACGPHADNGMARVAAMRGWLMQVGRAESTFAAAHHRFTMSTDSLSVPVRPEHALAWIVEADSVGFEAEATDAGPVSALCRVEVRFGGAATEAPRSTCSFIPIY